MAVDQLYLDNLEEFVNDENKVVTYKWLSRTLSVHVNQAKQMLYTFVQQQRNKKDNDKLSVCYFLSGISETAENGKILKAMVVPEESLDSMKATLSKMTSCHVYSVQKAKLKDSNALYIADYDTLKGSLLQSRELGAIKLAGCKPRSEEELGKLEALVQPISADPPSKVSTMNGSSVSKSKTKQSAGIADMFSNASKKKEEKTETMKEEGKGDQEKEDAVPAKNKAKQGAIGSFFAKQQSKASTKSETTKVEASVKKQSTKSHEKPPPKRGQNAKKTKKPDSDDEEEAATRKQKRRRIQVVESSSEEEEDAEEDVIPESPVPSPAAPVPSSPEPEKMEQSYSDEEKEEEENMEVAENKKEGPEVPKSPSSGKHRVKRRKKVTKTYMDDEGFMVTQDVWETESIEASDIDEPTKPVPPAAISNQELSAKTGVKEKKGQPAKKKASPDPKTSGKQTSLMSFFKKK